ncbi:MAG TPA: preprotein translocase subunit SecE [Clostridiales bacterium]|jgi:preprotein translocase subunit SecE|nr:preprotein translocase subunit SecE [Clostridiales bacterium]
MSNKPTEKTPAARSSAKKTPPKRQRVSLGEYFRGVRTEMKKVVWPTKEELASYTWVVLLTCTVFAVLFWAFDSAILAALRAVLNINI